MNYAKSMNIKNTIGIIIALLLITTLAFNTGCNIGSASIRLEGMSLGTVTMDGKPVEGLPSDKVNLLLEVSAQEITVGYTANGAILTISPSGATLEITSSGILIKGIKSEQIKVEWAVTKQD